MLVDGMVERATHATVRARRFGGQGGLHVAVVLAARGHTVSVVVGGTYGYRLNRGHTIARHSPRIYTNIHQQYLTGHSSHVGQTLGCVCGLPHRIIKRKRKINTRI